MRVVFNSSIVEVNVSSACDVSAAAALIGFQLSVPGQVQLTFNDCVLKHPHSLSDYGIQDDSVIMAVFPVPSSATFITVNVRTFTGDIYPVLVRSESDIGTMLCLCAIALGQRLENLSFILGEQMWTGRSLELQGLSCMRFRQPLPAYGITEGTVITGIKHIEHIEIVVFNVLTDQSLEMRVPANFPCSEAVRTEVKQRWGITTMRQRLFLDTHCTVEFTDVDRLDNFEELDDLDFDIDNLSRLYMLDFEEVCRCGLCSAHWWICGWICPSLFHRPCRFFSATE